MTSLAFSDIVSFELIEMRLVKNMYVYSNLLGVHAVFFSWAMTGKPLT